MFCQPSNDNNSVNENKQVFLNQPSKNNQSKKKQKKLGKKARKRNHSKLVSTMSTWAENFTVAATWQLKHQVAYWKARAKALEYENGVLHDVIRRNQHTIDVPSSTRRLSARNDTTVEAPSEEYCESDDQEDGFEVSEQFIHFLAENAKFKEEARLERERLKAKQEEENAMDLQEEPRETIEENQERLKELYGDKWQRISALETNMVSKFINECDKNKPVYWPNIPFNFNYS